MDDSALAQVHNQSGGEAPDIDAGRLEAFCQLIQQLVQEDKLLVYHDRSDGGLFVALAEVAFASRHGMNLDLLTVVNKNINVQNECYSLQEWQKFVLTTLFNEELGAIIAVHAADHEYISNLCEKLNLTLYHLGELTGSGHMVVSAGEEIFNQSLTDLQRARQETSHTIQRLRNDPAYADSEFALIGDNERSALFADVKFNVKKGIIAPFINSGAKPKIAILREQGANRQIEMAAASTRAGFDAYDVHMSNLMASHVHPTGFKMLAAHGGFNYSDILSTGEGWIKSILFHPVPHDQFAAFLADLNTLTLDVCNGCQMVSNLAEIIPGTAGWPKFKRNLSEQFEVRLSMAHVLQSASLILNEMQGSSLPVVVSHGEGRADFVLHGDNISADLGIALQYVDGQNKVTQICPLNPNDSSQGIASVTNTDGRVTIMMPHPECVYRAA